MRHVPSTLVRSIALALPLLLLASAPIWAATPIPSPTPNPIYECAGKIVGVKGLRDYTNNSLKDIMRCAQDRLASSVTPSSCPPPLNDDDGDLLNEAIDCEVGALDALCPLGADVYSPELINALVGSAATSVKSQLLALVDDVFFTANDACDRPVGPVSSDARECADKIQEAIVGQETLEQMEECFFSCERPRIAQSGLEVCTDDITGEPIKQKVIDCEASNLEDGLDQLDSRCTQATIEELGCPLGAESLSGLKSKLTERMTTFVRQLNLGIFHSPCQGNLPGGPTEPVPAQVTLEPSMTHTQVTCGQTLDNAFFGSNKTISFDSDLDCGPSKTATDGLIIAKSKVTLNGRLKTRSLHGPSRSSLRTGTGIRLAPGVARVEIRNFKAIENFGIGIEDAAEGNNKKIIIVKSTVRRNVIAGIRMRSPRVSIEQVTADKNGIGFDLSGDGIKLKQSFAKGSVYEPKVGIRLSGIDKNLNGSIVQVVGLNSIEQNQGVGILIAEGAHIINGNNITSNVGAGIVVDLLAAGNVIDTNNIKLNGSCMVVNSDNNIVDTNTCEENAGDGFVIAGIGNKLLNNRSGKKTDRGNAGDGYVISGQSVWMEDNESEANVGSGIVLTPTSSTTFFKGNNAQNNLGNGFDIQSPENTFEACAAADNNADDPPGSFHEWTLVANNHDNDGNKAGGDTVLLPADGGYCDSASDCPLPH